MRLSRSRRRHLPSPPPRRPGASRRVLEMLMWCSLMAAIASSLIPYVTRSANSSAVELTVRLTSPSARSSSTDCARPQDRARHDREHWKRRSSNAPRSSRAVVARLRPRRKHRSHLSPYRTAGLPCARCHDQASIGGARECRDGSLHLADVIHADWR
jgi:hypothetical protein